MSKDKNPSPQTNLMGVSKVDIEVAASLLKRARFEHSMDRITADLTVEQLEATLGSKGQKSG